MPGEDAQLNGKFQLRNRIQGIAVDPQGERIAVALDEQDWSSGGLFGPKSHGFRNTIQIFDLSLGKLITEFVASEGWDAGFLGEVAISSDGKKVLTQRRYSGDVWESDAFAPELWDSDTGISIGLLERYYDTVPTVALSADGTLVAAGGRTEAIKLWDAASSKQIKLTLEGHERAISSLAFSSTGRLLASASIDGTIRIWNTSSGRMVQKINPPDSSVYSVAFSPDGGLLASIGSDKALRLWDPDTGLEHRNLGQLNPCLLPSIFSISFSSNGRLIAAAGSNATHSFQLPCPSLPMSYDHLAVIQVWDVLTGAHTPPRYFEHPAWMGFALDQETLVVGYSDKLRWWDIDNNELSID